MEVEATKNSMQVMLIHTSLHSQTPTIQVLEVSNACILAAVREASVELELQRRACLQLY